MVSTKISALLSTLIIIFFFFFFFFCTANQHIRMISEGSCDTEDWSNDAENSALHHRNKLYFKYIQIENTFLIIIIFHNITAFLYFQLNKCRFGELTRFSKTLTNLKLFNSSVRGLYRKINIKYALNRGSCEFFTVSASWATLRLRNSSILSHTSL